MQSTHFLFNHPRPHRQQGVALFVVIVFVMLSMLLALWASRTSLFNELVVGNDADYQRAFEAAQSLLQDAAKAPTETRALMPTVATIFQQLSRFRWTVRK